MAGATEEAGGMHAASGASGSSARGREFVAHPKVTDVTTIEKELQ